MQVTIDAWSLFFVMCSSQGILLATLLFLKQNSKIQHIRLLSGIVFGFSVMLMYYVAYWTGASKQIHRLFALPLVFTWLIGPLTLNYVHSLEAKKRTNIFEWIPALIYGAILVFSAFMDLRETSILGFSIWSVLSIMLLLQLSGYSYLLFSIKEKSNWAKIVTWLFSGFVLGNFIYYVLVWTGLLNPTYDYIVSLFISLFIYTIGYYGYNEEQLFTRKKYASSELTPTAIRFLASKLTDYMTSEKPYRDHELNLSRLSQYVNISKHQLSQVINESFGLNYFEYVNQHRIDEAKKILNDPAQQEIKLNQLAYKVGFNNKVTFNTAFKKFTGQSPSQYKKKIEELAI